MPNSGYVVETLSKGLVNKIPTCHRLTSRSTKNTLEYLSADQFNDDTWATLEGHHFNLVFSDGVHTPDALRTELNFLIRHDLIDRSRFIMLWDDLNHPDMQVAFVENAKALCRIFNKGNPAFSLYDLRGSYCDYNADGISITRPMGIFYSLG